MNKKIIALLVFLPCILLLLFVSQLSIQKALLPEVTIRIAGYDPRDLLAGHYIAYSIDWEKTDCNQFEGAVCPEENFKGLGTWKQHRFYIPEAQAEKLDTLFSGLGSNKYIFEVVYSYNPNISPKPKKLLINKQDWRKFVN